MARASMGKETVSHAPNRVIIHADGTVSIGINRKPAYYFGAMILPDGTFAANVADTRKEVVQANMSELGLSDQQVRRYHGNNAGEM